MKAAILHQVYLETADHEPYRAYHRFHRFGRYARYSLHFNYSPHKPHKPNGDAEFSRVGGRYGESDRTD